MQVIRYEAKSRELKAFNVRLSDLNVIDLCFLRARPKPTIAYIYQVRSFLLPSRESDSRSTYRIRQFSQGRQDSLYHGN